MKRVVILATVCTLILGTPIPTYAKSLDDVISEQGTESVQEEPEVIEQQSEPEVVEQQSTPEVVEQPASQSTKEQPTTNYSSSSSQLTTDQYLSDLKEATDLTTAETSPGADRINQGIKKVAAFIIKVVSYFLIAFLAVRVVIDLCYVCLPFTRSFLANGYGGNPQAGGGGMGMQQPGMGMGGMGMGMNSGMGGMGMGMGGMGMRGGYGMNRMGMGGMGMGMQQGQIGATPAFGRAQWVSNAALNAVAAEQVPGPDGKPMSPLKIYAKDMTVVLVITPILLTLAITGVLTQLGFLLGALIADAVSNIGNML